MRQPHNIEGGAIMCLFFYLAGVLSGYISWRMANAPRLWDAEEEAKTWQRQWVVSKNENDLLRAQIGED
jgi:hypothetical protein